jgi:BirA family biotin operon repressor/biotin-[acetyl-CoA-carboxylase] ligase
MFNLARIFAAALVRHVDHHVVLGSTSDRALELAARDGAPLPLLVLAERQTSGRGRGTNRWWSSEGALTFSLVLDAAGALPADQRPTVALAAGLAICEALEALVPQAAWQVKWPNDVLAGGGKVCGILCESVPGWPERLVVGVGINVNNAFRGQRTEGRGQGTGDRRQETAVSGQGSVVSGQEVLRGAVALIDIDGLVRDLTEVLLAVLDRMDFRWNELVGSGFRSIAGEYRRRCFLTGKPLKVTSGNEQLVGVCRGMDDRGGLVLATEAGPRTILAGSIDAWE